MASKCRWFPLRKRRASSLRERRKRIQYHRHDEVLWYDVDCRCGSEVLYLIEQFNLGEIIMNANSFDTRTTIYGTHEVLEAGAGEVVLLAKGSSSAGREGRQVRIPAFNLSEVPAEFHSILGDALWEQAKETLRAQSAETRSIAVAEFSAISLAAAYEAAHRKIDWSLELGRLESLLMEYQISLGVPEKAARTRARERLMGAKMLRAACEAGETLSVSIKNSLVLATEKLLGWAALPDWAPASLEIWIDMLGKVSVHAEDIV